jgi:hypothetical protein
MTEVLNATPEVATPEAPVAPELFTADVAAPEVPTPTPAVPEHYLPGTHITVPRWLSVTAGSAIIFLIIVILVMGGALAYQSWRANERDVRRDHVLEVLTTNMIRMNEQQVIRNIVEEKLPQLSAEDRSKVAFEIYEGCRRNAIPFHLMLGLIEQESGWNPKAVSSAGARGLMQVMPDSGMFVAEAHGQVFTMDKLFDPVTNVIWGTEILMKKHEMAIALGKSSRGDFSMALNYYVGGDPKYILQVMQKAVAYKKRLDAPMAEANLMNMPHNKAE